MERLPNSKLGRATLLAVGVLMNGDDKNARLLLAKKVQMRDLERHMTVNLLRRLKDSVRRALKRAAFISTSRGT